MQALVDFYSGDAFKLNCIKSRIVFHFFVQLQGHLNNTVVFLCCFFPFVCSEDMLINAETLQ